MFLYPDGTLFIQLINFVIFFAILRVVFLRPVAAAIRKRREYINGLVADYDRYQAEAQVLRDEAESVRATARRDAEQRIAAARAQASNEAADIASSYAQRAQAIVEEASQRVAAELASAREGEARIVEGLSEMMLERVFAESAR